ncbi:hypothetical protein FSP39_006685 [Pinctada imbricata]|uniref:SSD domain-containing protein n=1 Tax=Pinctada imbricata TaxID=66713 RepID=A0AA88Y6X6_PINIB|nr:hypothetical protein FSP39_006685 [Pinctada imbricata]
MGEETKKKGCHYKYENAIGNVFGRYGRFVASGPKIPWIILSICTVINIGLGLGMLTIKSISDSETLYTPQNSQASKDRTTLKGLFSDYSGNNFYSYSITDFNYFGEVLIKTKNDVNILTSSFMTEIKSIDAQIRAVVASDSGVSFNYSDVCALRAGACVVSGEVVLSTAFETAMLANNIDYPVFNGESIAGTFGGLQTSGGKLTSSYVVKLVYNLRTDTAAYESKSLAWEKAFITAMESISSANTELAYQSSDSVNSALDESTAGDIKFFSVTFTLMITYACCAGIAVNLNCVAWRANLAMAGVFAACLAILSSFGFISLCTVEFVNIVGVMPFLIIGIGIDDVFILLSGIADAVDIKDGPGKTVIENKMFFALKHSGVAITITSITDFLAFAIGASSTFISVRNFCLYTGFAVFFCYLNQLFFFVPCIVINERRVEANRHFMSCMKTRSKEELKKDGKSRGHIFCCAGEQPKDRNDYDSYMEKYPKMLFQKIVKPLPCKIIILVCFAGYLAASIYGAVNLKQGLELRNLAADDSYFYKYDTWNRDYMPSQVPISFIIKSRQTYSAQTTQDSISAMLTAAKQDADIDDNIEINWLTAFQADASYTTTSESAFVSALVTFIQSNTKYENDVLFDSTNTHIDASRFYVFTVDLKDSQKQGKMMQRMRDIANNNALPAFPFHPSFIFFEQFVTILSATLQTIGIAVAAMTVITIIFMPYPVLVIFVMVTMMMILIGIFGFMHYWDLTLSSVTMIQLVMTVGFSVDFSAHICHGFISVSGSSKEDRVHKALDRTGGAVINAAFSSILGIMMLLASSGYIFRTFFKLMFLVMLFGLLHSVLFLPVVLSLIGPRPAEHTAGMQGNKTNYESNITNEKAVSISEKVDKMDKENTEQSEDQENPKV